MDFECNALNSLKNIVIKEVAESSKNIIIIFELEFLDGSVKPYQYRIEKCKIQVNDINGMVL